MTDHNTSPKPFTLAPGIELGGDGALPWVAGPCVIEAAEFTVDAAKRVAAMAERVGTPAVFKSSFDKANRSSIDSFRGPGLLEGLEILRAAGEASGLPLLTDVHQPAQCGPVAEVCDVLQIPAFLCRQTDLIVEAARTGKPVLIKKGQFMAPLDMVRSVDKARSQGNERVAVTERGTTFGYQNLVVDMRSFKMLSDRGISVVYDVTHSLQLPGAHADHSGGDRRFAETLARAAIAAGAAGLYIECHPEPEQALCDSETQLPMERAEAILRRAIEDHSSIGGRGPGA